MAILKGHLGFKGEKGDTGEIGTPKVYKGTYEELQFDTTVDTERFYVIVNSDDNYNGHWFYYDEDNKVWLDGGMYMQVVVQATNEGTDISGNMVVAYYETTAKSETEFSLPSTYVSGCYNAVYVNGMKLKTSDYTLTSNRLILKTALDVVGTQLEVDFNNNISLEVANE